MTVRVLGLVAALLLGAGAHAAETVFRNITWPRHSKRTGFLEWELRAVTARPMSNDEYACSQLEANTYKLTERDGRKFSRKEMTVCADKGTYHHGAARSDAFLEGHVVGLLHSADPLRITTDRATIVSTWDSRTQIRDRTIVTRSKVSADSVTRSLTGEGMTVFDQTNEKDDTTLKSSLRVERDVTMVIRGGTAAGALPAMSGAASKPPDPNAAPEPVTVTCAGPLVYDRIENRAVFNDRATLTRGDTSLKASRLTATFEEPDEAAGTRFRMKRLLAEDDVVIAGTGQNFAGTRFEWDPELSAGSLAGSPAVMRTTDSTARADKIEFDQKTQKIKYVGSAEVEIELKAE